MVEGPLKMLKRAAREAFRQMEFRPCGYLGSKGIYRQGYEASNEDSPKPRMHTHLGCSVQRPVAWRGVETFAQTSALFQIVFNRLSVANTCQKLARSPLSQTHFHIP